MRERNSNIELLRIIAMMGVVALHYVHGGIGGVEKYADSSEFVWFFVAGVRSAAIPLVNVFVLVSGYFMIHSTKFSLRKIINLLVITMFYGAVLYVASSSINHTGLSVAGLIKKMLPFFFGSAWFIKTYIILLFIAPFLSKLLSSLTIQNYRRLLVIQILLFSVWYSLGFDSPVLDDGYGIINFITLYMLGGYMGRFLNDCSILSRISSRKALFGYFGSVLLTGAASYFINPFGYAFITNIIGATLLFLSIAKLNAAHSKAVNVLSGKAFDVFFIHGYVFRFLRIDSVATTVCVIPHLVFSVICCYLVGFVCGCIREFVLRHTIYKLLDRAATINRVSYV